MALAVIRKLTSGLLPPLALFALLLVSLYLLSYAVQQSDRFEHLYEWMLLINTVALLVLVALIGINLYRLIRQYRTSVIGSKLTVRLFVMFVVLSVVPVAVVYYFSFQFLKQGIDSWFDVQIERPLENALELSQASLDLRKRELLRRTEEIADDLADVSENEAALRLNELRVRSDATELSLLGSNSRIIAFSSAEQTAVVPHRPTDDVLLQVRQARTYIAVEPIRDTGLQVRVAVEVPSLGAGAEPRYLQALFPITQRLNALADSVQSAFAQYKALAYQRAPLKKSVLLALSLVLMLSLLSAVWAAFFSARRLVAPIRNLAEGTRAVAEGNYDKRLPPAGYDELGYLVRSFNDMTRKIAQASNEAQRSRQQVEEQRAYLQAVLGRLSSGVLTLDREKVLRTANAAASHILGLALQEQVGRPLDAIARQFPHMAPFAAVVAAHVDAAEAEWSEEVTFFSGNRQVLMCRGTSLQGEDSGHGDHVIVFDDVTALVQAQRDAAWGEVARRLAHEIKNPLTPIQLSAERLRHKYLKTMPEKDAQVLDRLTHTIVQQVEAMKEMVNAFSEYARVPKVELAPRDLNALVKEVSDLYSGVDLELRLDPAAPVVDVDSGRLRQLLHNLIKNALEAMQGMGHPRLEVSTAVRPEAGRGSVDLVVRDFGHGFAIDTQAQYFEPYVTTKPKGTGLGLAIVKKIVEEHGGMVWMENVEPIGAQIIVRLPLSAKCDAGDAPGRPEQQAREAGEHDGAIHPGR